ncbi:ketopantoate hydroxymethyltransferase [Psychrobacillus sp.]|uniref:ketopantoate hydroxymethyltransferase n=1 Tax=Psychrobacillus sp. TaxID=1871623 RepID=UPI0028BDD43B|nr:ketopantoate hydroxymethyltransferase [Psychrobacillus sp.]
MIRAEFINEIAQFIETKIDKVRINDIYDIKNFTIKSVSEGKVNMAYMIPNGAVTKVTNMALLDEHDLVIAANDVYIPISSDTDISHTFTIVEVV